MSFIWYFILYVLFIICSPNIIFSSPFSKSQYLDKTAITLLHGCIFIGIWYLLYDTSIISTLFSSPKKIQPPQKIQRLEMSPDTTHFQHRLGDGSK